MTSPPKISPFASSSNTHVNPSFPQATKPPPSTPHHSTPHASTSSGSVKTKRIQATDQRNSVSACTSPESHQGGSSSRLLTQLQIQLSLKQRRNNIHIHNSPGSHGHHATRERRASSASGPPPLLIRAMSSPISPPVSTPGSGTSRDRGTPAAIKREREREREANGEAPASIALNAARSALDILGY